MAGLRKPADKTMTVAVGTHATVTRHRCALGIVNALVELKTCRFATHGEFNCAFRVYVPGMIKIEIRKLRAHQVGVRQTRIGIRRRKIGK